MSEKESPVQGAKDEPRDKDSKKFGNHKLNQNVVRTLQAASEACQRSDIGAIFEKKDLHSNDLPDPLLPLRRLLDEKVSRFERSGANMPGNTVNAIKHEIQIIANTIESLDQGKIEIWADIVDKINQLPKGLESVIIVLPISSDPGGGVGYIDLTSKKGYSYATL